MADAFPNVDQEQINKNVKERVKAVLDKIDFEAINERVKKRLSTIDALKSDDAFARLKIENQLKMDLERLKIELGTTGQTYGFEATMSQREKSDNFSIEDNMTYASRQFGPAAAVERYEELNGEKTVPGPGGQTRKMTFPEFYRESYKNGKKPKEIITLWGTAR